MRKRDSAKPAASDMPKNAIVFLRAKWFASCNSSSMLRSRIIVETLSNSLRRLMHIAGGLRELVLEVVRRLIDGAREPVQLVGAGVLLVVGHGACPLLDRLGHIASLLF